jgi:protein-S-isoprenylcysteine O-methyltransferase Ste14
MRRSAAATGSAIFFALAPGAVAGLLPWGLTRWHMSAPLAHWLPLRLLGLLLLLAGAAVLMHAFVQFVVEGLGTPAPVAPPTRLVIGGMYRYVRNPMYVAVIAAILAQALLLWQPVLLGYGGLAAAAMVTFVVIYEQPALAGLFGDDYATYRRHVPGWLPRLRPWDGRVTG